MIKWWQKVALMQSTRNTCEETYENWETKLRNTMAEVACGYGGREERDRDSWGDWGEAPWPWPIQTMNGSSIQSHPFAVVKFWRGLTVVNVTRVHLTAVNVTMVSLSDQGILVLHVYQCFLFVHFFYNSQDHIIGCSPTLGTSLQFIYLHILNLVPNTCHWEGKTPSNVSRTTTLICPLSCCVQLMRINSWDLGF